ncbi:Methylenetetrahydrofolate dehydrogenase/methylenetetrahydrofolate cyclohydrolase [Handroanthus impetiginosus]|uniref:Methylenetetrahydrofolate dehydrogenase/methylenetetrahydrofolate cyclohydrolase n=1 Tax=Handroanthus impetiginosus TaxID=429701 RepID=A0A2G9G6U5_9LAMI|nr:Methylenetetrahydrofolate dehydrogenase/methylenetetrahydrofolate cyclohydrolase [Handroanthus impetiginosus]
MSRRMFPVVAALQPIWLRKNFLAQYTSRAFSSQILKSPSLLSLDRADSWCSASKQSDHLAIQECSNNWTAEIIDGKAIAEGIRSRIASEVRQMKELIGEVPSLAVILVGQRRDSQTYVRNKIIASEEVGIRLKMIGLPENCTESEVCNALCRFNEDPSIHGILVQLPLPQHLDEAKILNAISLEKDVDGFHPLNIGSLAMQGMEPLFIPCTPKGCIELLLQSGIEITGKKAVVIGRSNIVGLPKSLLLQRHHATVTVLHAFTKNPEKIAREADILVTAAGVPNLVRASWLKPGAVIVDVGTNPVEDPRSEYGYHLIGDVCFDEATRIASAITPVPGGVGPMTVAMLLYNTLESARRAFKFTY